MLGFVGTEICGCFDRPVFIIFTSQRPTGNSVLCPIFKVSSFGVFAKSGRFSEELDFSGVNSFDGVFRVGRNYENLFKHNQSGGFRIIHVATRFRGFHRLRVDRKNFFLYCTLR